MIKIWAKLMTDHKIIKQYTYPLSSKIVYSRFFEYTSQICGELDVPTPVILKTHIFNFAKFNFVRFTKDDFVESFDYDNLVLEYIIV